MDWRSYGLGMRKRRFFLHIAHITHIGVTVDWKWVAGWGSEKAGSGS
jgi:hypothetical protein